MKNISNYIKKDFIILLQNSVILIAAIGIAVSPFIVDYATLPKGFELPKVFFYQVICALIIGISLIVSLIKLKKFDKFNIRSIPKSLVLVILISFLFLLSTAFSTHVEIAIWGNSFRFQGVITYLLMLWAAYGVYCNITYKNWHLLTIGLIFSTIIQCGYALNQFFELAKTNPNAILEGIWVNGTFGQANWFAGRILIGIIFAAYYLGLRLNSPKAIRILFKLYFGIIVFFFLTVLGLTQSEWGIISGVFALLLILLYELLPKKIFTTLLIFILLLGGIVVGIFLKYNTEYNLRIEILVSIWNIITQPLNMTQIKVLLFGFGFDTLGQVFQDHGMIKGLLVDRAHNFVLDIIIQNGFVVLAIFIGLVTKQFKAMLNKNKNRIVDFTFIALIAWMFRSVIHENGIVNLMDFFVFFAVCISLINQKSHNIHGLNTK